MRLLPIILVNALGLSAALAKTDCVELAKVLKEETINYSTSEKSYLNDHLACKSSQSSTNTSVGVTIYAIGGAFSRGTGTAAQACERDAENQRSNSSQYTFTSALVDKALDVVDRCNRAVENGWDIDFAPNLAHYKFVLIVKTSAGLTGQIDHIEKSKMDCTSNAYTANGGLPNPKFSISSDHPVTIECTQQIAQYDLLDNSGVIKTGPEAIFDLYLPGQQPYSVILPAFTTPPIQQLADANRQLSQANERLSGPFIVIDLPLPILPAREGTPNDFLLDPVSGSATGFLMHVSAHSGDGNPLHKSFKFSVTSDDKPLPGEQFFSFDLRNDHLYHDDEKYLWFSTPNDGTFLHKKLRVELVDGKSYEQAPGAFSSKVSIVGYK